MSKWQWNFKKPSAVRLAVDQQFKRPTITPYKIDWSRVVTIDFETYYDDDYSLTKLSTSEYVRHPKFKVQMMGIKIGRGKTKIIPGHKVAQELAKIDWTTHALLCHNTQFDGFVLGHHFNVHPYLLLDTLSMARGLHSNDIGAGLDEVAVYYGGHGKLDGILGKTKGVLDWDKKLFAEVGTYCANDVDECFRIFQCMLPKMPADEIELIDLTCKMFCDPVLKVDIPRVQAELKRELDRRDELFSSIIDVKKYDAKKILKAAERGLPEKERNLLIVKRVIGSNEKFAKLLREEGVEPPTKISPAWIKKPKDQRTDEDKYAYAFAKDDQKFLDLAASTFGLDLEDPKQVAKLVVKQQRIQDLIDCRIAVKSTSNVTRSERFLTAGAGGASLPAGYAYYRAHTGRWGGQNKMNLQNLKRGGELRLSILAPKGHVLVVTDSGQIEARVNGWLWGQTALMDAFRASDRWDKKTMGVARGDARDAYCKFADLIYGREITTDDFLERFVGKVCVLGLGFQMGAAKLQLTLAKGALGGPPVNFSLAQCQAIVKTYRATNDKIAAGWTICNQIIEDMANGTEGAWGPLNWEKDTLWLPNGMCLKYPGLRKAKSEDTGWDEWTYQAKDIRKKIYGGLLCENIVQALARIIVGMQMLMISKRGRVVLTTHDEVVSCVRAVLGASMFKFMLKSMSTPLDWCRDIPLNCEGGFAPNYSK